MKKSMHFMQEFVFYIFKDKAFFLTDFLGAYENPVADFRGGAKIRSRILGGVRKFDRKI